MSELSFVASPDDGKAILEVLESSAAKGKIELLYTRRPDAYASYMKEPGEAKVFVSRSDGRVVGTCAELIRDAYIGGERRKTCYICGLKKDASHSGLSGLGLGFIRELKQEGADLYYCSVVSENAQARRIFDRIDRVLTMKPFAEYRTFIISPKVRLKAPVSGLVFRSATEEDLPALLNFLNSEGRKKDLFPAIDSLDGFTGLKIDDFRLLTDESGIAAAGALWDQSGYKQYVVKRYSAPMKAVRVFNPLLSALGYVKLPKENIPLSFPMLSFMLSRDDSEEIYRVFLANMIREAGKKYGMLVAGLPTNHFAFPIYDKLKSISFGTTLYSVAFPGKTEDNGFSSRTLQPECALL